MKKMILRFALVLVGFTMQPLLATELLTNGDLESGAGSGIIGWSLLEYPSTGGDSFDTASQTGFADRGGDPDAFGLWLKPWAGGGEPPGTLMNAEFSQTVPASPGEGYSFSGYSRWELNYSGGVSTLDPQSASGAIPSPTRTEMSLVFLDAGGSQIGAPFVLDLRTQQNNFDAWVQHRFDDSFNGGSPIVAPAGTASVRIGASMFDGAHNFNDPQSAFFDDFSLVAESSGLELLVNGSIDEVPPDFPGWNVTEAPEAADPVSPAGFAQNPNSSGQTGAWLRPWSNGGLVGDPNNAIFEQEVSGVAGGDYMFSLWSRFEPNFAGGVDTLDAASPNGAVSSPTQTSMELTFLDSGGLVLGTFPLDIRTDRESQSGTANANDNEWYQHVIQATAPNGTATVRVNGSMLDGVFNIDPGQSAFFDDFSLTLGTLTDCDFTDDGNCDGMDIDLLVAEIAAGTNDVAFDLTGDGLVNLEDRDEWLTQAGAMNLASGNPYLLGDATLDGAVDGQDFVAWNGSKFSAVAAWTAGDFNADGLVDGQDFIIWNGSKFTMADGRLVVPEGSSTWMALLAAAVGLMLHRRNG